MKTFPAVAAALMLVTAVGCGRPLETRWAARPAESFSSIQELASNLRDEGLCSDFSPVPRAKLYPMAYCHPQGGKLEEIGLLVASFPDEDIALKIKRDDETGCNGPMVWGPNWSVGPLAYDDIDEVLEAVGGEVIGASETRHC